ncbi:hypothetical protein VP01_7604g1 [Puccinia sorghi]|uniref:Uncharacterized protein n=1 Tax=Puccinia sorghi TaxID=27349 RepID=A0A0L6UBW1_9BASI|nr:hypothetical protein VP01_7604g1 [Puccinia sorghi]
MWIKLESNYQSKAIANQAKVYNDFLALKFKGTNIDQFIADLTSHISSISSVGLRIGIPTDFEIHENLFCKSILDKIPTSLVHTQEVLIQNCPLNIEKLTDLLENQCRDDTTIWVKSEESVQVIETHEKAWWLPKIYFFGRVVLVFLSFCDWDCQD